MTVMKRAIVFDLDSTIAHTLHREGLAPANDRHLLENWIAYSQACVDDGVVEGVARALDLYYHAGFFIAFCSGRNEEAREQTVEWLDKNGICFDELKLHTDEDPRHNAEHKVKYIKELQAAGYVVELMFEDHVTVCEQVERETGVPCVTVRPRYEDGVGVSFNLSQYSDTELGKTVSA